MSPWQFSESSQPLLKRCIEASPLDPNNKWVKRFGHLLRKEIPENVVENEPIISLSSTDESADSQATVVLEKLELAEDDLQELLETDPVTRFDFIVENCLNNVSLYSVLAKQLSLTSVEKLCEHIFETKDEINSNFLQCFYTNFLPTYLKREHSRTFIDLIINAEKCNCEFFKKFLEIIVIDTEVPSQVLEQFIATLDDNKRLVLLNDIIQFDISDEVFIHHLHSISMIYKNCQKSELIQNFILTKLSGASQECSNDKIYGRLLLNYLQAQKNFTTNFAIVQKIVNMHRSPFRKPCLNAFNEIKKKFEETE